MSFAVVGDSLFGGAINDKSKDRDIDSKEENAQGCSVWSGLLGFLGGSVWGSIFSVELLRGPRPLALYSILTK